MGLPTPKTPLSSCLNLYDFEKVAQQTLKPKSWAYYHSSSDDSKTMQKNTLIYSEIRFRPRVLIPVREIDTSIKILGFDSKFPFFISPAAMGKLAHESGEIALVKGAHKAGIHYGVSTAASVSHLEIANARTGDQVLFFQLYVMKDREKTRTILSGLKDLGYKAVIFTVDTPIPGNRELDLRTGLDENTIQLDESNAKVGEKKSAIAQSSQLMEADLTWSDIGWIQRVSGLKVVVKGVQTVDDALLCETYGADAIMLSNHGGRQLDTTLTPIETLLEIERYAPHLLSPSSSSSSLKKTMEIFVDSGIRRGTDVVIALCLGAKAVSLGRPFMYSLCYGEEGVAKCAEILGDEVARAMRLLGVRNIAELKRGHVNTKKLERLIYGGVDGAARL